MTAGQAFTVFWFFSPWILVAAAFVGRNWIKAELEKGIQHRFDQRLEKLRGELRKSEEHLKADLRKKENEIGALRTSVLTGSAARQALLDKRRLDAVERVWIAVNDMAKLKHLASMMAVLKFDALADRSHEPNIQKFLEIIGNGTPDVNDVKNVARDERPFLPELAWAYFNAYINILYSSSARFHILKIGMKDAREILADEPLQKILKAALPHQSDWIDKHDPTLYYYLLDELETLLLRELRGILEGTEADKAAAEKAQKILNALGGAEHSRAEQEVENAGIQESLKRPKSNAAPATAEPAAGPPRHTHGT